MAFNPKNNNDFNFKEIHKNNKYLNTFKEKITINKDLKKDSFKYENEIPNNIVKNYNQNVNIKKIKINNLNNNYSDKDLSATLFMKKLMKENYNEIFKDNNDNSNLNNISIKKTQTFNNNTDQNEIIQKNYNDNANDFLNEYLEDNYEDNDNNYFEDENNLEILKNIEMPSPEVKIKDNKYSIEFVSNNYEYLNEKKKFL